MLHTPNQKSSPFGVQSDYAQLMKARRMATRRRAEAACIPCKIRKSRCNDYRPCARCTHSGRRDCVDGAEPDPVRPTTSLFCKEFAAFWSQHSHFAGMATKLQPNKRIQFPPPTDISTISFTEGTTTCEVGASRGDWLWEVAGGPGKDTPFEEDWKRSQLLLRLEETIVPLALL